MLMMKHDSSLCTVKYSVTAWKNLLAPGCFILMYLSMPYCFKASSHLKCFPLLQRETLSGFLWFSSWSYVLNHWNNLFFQNKPHQLYVAVFYIHFYITMLLSVSYWYRIKFCSINNSKYLLMFESFQDFKFWNIVSYLA